MKFQGGSVETPFCYEYPKDPKRGLRQTPFLKGVFRGYLGGMNMVQWSCCDKKKYNVNVYNIFEYLYMLQPYNNKNNIGKQNIDIALRTVTEAG